MGQRTCSRYALLSFSGVAFTPCRPRPASRGPSTRGNRSSSLPSEFSRLGLPSAATLPARLCSSLVALLQGWSSLHLVLCYAESKTSAGVEDVHIAVMDTKNLEEEVLVWQCSHLINKSNEEYLAFGRVAGRGYKVVKLADLKAHDLLKLFPQLQDGSWREGDISWQFGDNCRRAGLRAASKDVILEHLRHAEAVAVLFGSLSTPVITALLCLQPRPWLTNACEIESTLLNTFSECIERI